MAATSRQEKEMTQKYAKAKTDPKLTHLERLRAHVLSNGVRSLKTLHRNFKKIDESGNNKIDLHEFKDALKYIGINATDEDVRQCFSEIDKSGDGDVDIDEFIVALRPPMSQRRMDLVHQAFHKLDKSGDGTVTEEDLKGIYSANKHPKFKSGEMTEEDVFREFLNSFNGPNNSSGQVTLSDFEDYYAGVSASVDTDAYFDLMMRQAWKL